MESSAKPEPVSAAVQALPPGKYLLAFSGGRDSTVLLHALSRRVRQDRSFQLEALHIDHGLQEQSADWAQHCAQQARDWGVPCRLVRLLGPAPSGNLEAWAREQRYALLARAAADDFTVLTAHHQQDQAETLLLALLRGSGAEGLAAMPEQDERRGFRLRRPLLAVAPKAIEAYAQAQALQWQEDPSNQDLRFDRNFLRQRVFPVLRERFPSPDARLARSARLLAEQAFAADSPLRWQDFVQARPESQSRGAGLSLPALLRLSEAQRHHLLRDWLRSRNLSPPRYAIRAEIWMQFLQARDDAQPLIEWPGVQLRRYREALYAMSPLLPVDDLNWTLSGAGRRVWPYGGEIRWELPFTARVRLPQGGETIRWQGHQRRLKTLFQQAGVPPWERARTPLLYRDQELIAVGHRWKADSVVLEGLQWAFEESLFPH